MVSCWMSVGLSIRLSVHRLSIRLSVSFSFLDDNLSKHQWIFTTLGMCIAVFAKTAGLSDKSGKFSFCPAKNFNLSDKCPVISGKKK